MLAPDRRTLLVATVSAASLLGWDGEARGASRNAKGARRVLAFDSDWRFFRGEAAGAERLEFDDSLWTGKELPHDWSIEDLPGAPKAATDWQPPAAQWTLSRTGDSKPATPIRTAGIPSSSQPGGPPLRVGPFDPNASDSKWGTGWVVGGVGWYRKTFVGPALAAGERVEIRFDGAFCEAEVWWNGTRLGDNVYGYGAFAFDVTPHYQAGRRNVVAVRITNEGETARWYSGSGLNRHAWLTITGAVRVVPWGIAVSTPRVGSEVADVTIEVETESHIASSSAVDATARIRDASGRTVAERTTRISSSPGAAQPAKIELQLPRPKLWNPETPHLYTAEVSLVADGRLTDRASTRFGVRSIAVSAERGLEINGRAVKLKGACVHSDHGLLGTASIDRAERRKVELLKRYGYNAIRLAHNMYPPAFLDACDELGMVVIDEVFDVWEKTKVFKQDYARYFKNNWRNDIARMVRQDRNHPSVVFWSIGNEIPEKNTPRGVEIAAELRTAVLALDTSRPITAAIDGVTGQFGEPARRSLDVIGYNYQHRAFERDHAQFPKLVFMSTEQQAQNIHDGWRVAEANSYVLGEFVWTGIDYLGEVGAGSSELLPAGASPRTIGMFLWDYPAFQSGCGEIDILGSRKPQGLYRDVLWGNSTVELLVQRPIPAGNVERVGAWGWHDELESWTWPEAEGRALTVRVYTAGDEVRLLLNGREVSRKPVAPADKLTATFEVPYAPGTLVAVASRGGREIGRKQLVTTGAPARVQLRADRSRLEASPNDLAYIFAEICDAQGRKVPDAAVPLTFTLKGAGRLRACGSANPRGVESFTDPACRTFHGEALAIVQGAPRGGRSTLAVSSPGLVGDALGLQIG